MNARIFQQDIVVRDASSIHDASIARKMPSFFLVTLRYACSVSSDNSTTMILNGIVPSITLVPFIITELDRAGVVLSKLVTRSDTLAGWYPEVTEDTARVE